MTVDFTELETVNLDERQQILDEANGLMDAMELATDRLETLANRLDAKNFRNAEDIEELADTLRLCASNNPISEHAKHLTEQAELILG